MTESVVDLKEMNTKQVKQDIELVDNNGRKTGKKVTVTLESPSWTDKLMINDLRNVGDNQSDMGEYYNQLLEKVLVNPRLDFKFMNEEIEKDVDKKDKKIEFKGDDGKNHKLTLHFPDYRTAINLINELYLLNGASNVAQFVEDCNKLVFRDSKGKAISNDYWDKTGGVYDVVVKTVEFLNDVLDTNNYLQILNGIDLFFQK